MSSEFNFGEFKNKITYTTGEFMLAWENVRAWFTAQGELKEAEFKRWDNGTVKCYPVQARHTRIRTWLEERGKGEAATSRHVRDVMKANMQKDVVIECPEKKAVVVEGLKVGQMVRCPENFSQPAFDAIVESIGGYPCRNINGIVYVWVTVRNNSGHASIWPSHRLGGKVTA